MQKLRPGLSANTVEATAGNGRTRYDALAMALHWLTALLVLGEFGLAELWGFTPRPTQHRLIVAHMSFGILLTLVLIVRIAWRLVPGHSLPDADRGWAEIAAKSMHRLLYVLLAIQAALGFVLRWSGNEAMSFFGWPIPPPFPAFSKAGHHLVGQAHDLIGWVIVILVACHALAALFHHLVLRDGVLERMLPKR
jgi:cytochrome b561